MPGKMVADTLSTIDPTTGGKSARLVVIRSGGSMPAATRDQLLGNVGRRLDAQQAAGGVVDPTADVVDGTGVIRRLHASDQATATTALVHSAGDVQEAVDDAPRRQQPNAANAKVATRFVGARDIPARGAQDREHHDQPARHLRQRVGWIEGSEQPRPSSCVLVQLLQRRNVCALSPARDCSGGPAILLSVKGILG